MKISLITACLNNAAVIGDNLESVKGQAGYFQLEHLFQDGGSSDGTLALLESYRDDVDYDVSVLSGQDHGFYDAINQGIERSSGDVIGLLNADDFLADGKVLAEVEKAFAEDSELDVVYSDLNFVKDVDRIGAHALEVASPTSAASRQEVPCLPDGVTPHEGVSSPRESRGFKIVRRWKSGTFSPDKFRRGWVPPHPTIYMRRRVWEQVGEYRLDFGTSADYDWMLRLFMKPGQGERFSSNGSRISPSGLKIRYLPKIMVNMRMGGQSTGSLKNRLVANKNDRRAWQVNGLRPALGFRFMKPLRKLGQWL